MTRLKKTYEKPLTIDASFDEALQKFVQTDPGEIDDSDDDRSPEDVRVSEDDGGNICLSDLFALADKPKNRKPNDWARGARAKRLMEALFKKTTGDSRRFSKDDVKTMYYSDGTGRGTRVYAHPVLALDYAEFVKPELGVAVRETFLRYKAKDVTLALEILDGLTAQEEYDTLRVELRNLVKEHNKLSAEAAKDIGVTNFEAYNGSGLHGLYGMTKAELLDHKELPEGENHLNFAGHEELAANYFKATQAAAKLKRDAAAGVKGQAHANKVHNEIGRGVRRQIESWGGTMPEDEPVLDHVKEAEKRLKAAEKDKAKKIGKKG
ncbi:MAG: KilA-N domain-containing protein [Hyphomicrobium sp.]|uniref:KilA-N domain-containing protein n=1 Tax=Hyphomicrobium sp. TaxID=82 RepID=UPI0035650414